jgi:hypothetical protein
MELVVSNSNIDLELKLEGGKVPEQVIEDQGSSRMPQMPQSHQQKVPEARFATGFVQIPNLHECANCQFNARMDDDNLETYDLVQDTGGGAAGGGRGGDGGANASTSTVTWLDGPPTRPTGSGAERRNS